MVAVLVFGGLVGAVGVEPLVGGGVAFVGVGVDVAGGQFDAGALFGGAGVGGVGVPVGADVVGFVELGGLPVEDVRERRGTRRLRGAAASRRVWSCSRSASAWRSCAAAWWRCAACRVPDSSGAT